MDQYMHVDFLLCCFSIRMSFCIVKEVMDAVVNVVPFSCGKMFGNRSNWGYHGGFNGAGIGEKGADDLLAVDGLWLC